MAPSPGWPHPKENPATAPEIPWYAMTCSYRDQLRSTCVKNGDSRNRWSRSKLVRVITDTYICQSSADEDESNMRYETQTSANRQESRQIGNVIKQIRLSIAETNPGTMQQIS